MSDECEKRGIQEGDDRDDNEQPYYNKRSPGKVGNAHPTIRRFLPLLRGKVKMGGLHGSSSAGGPLTLAPSTRLRTGLSHKGRRNFHPYLPYSHRLGNVLDCLLAQV